MRKLVSAFTAILLISSSFLTFSPNYAFAAEKIVKYNVETPAQQSYMWCWAAALQGIIRFKTGKRPTQCQIVRSGKNLPSCSDVGGGFIPMTRILNSYNIPTVTTFYPSLDQIKYSLDKKSPIIAVIVWGNYTSHAIVIDGYQGDWLFADYTDLNVSSPFKIKFSDLESKKESQIFETVPKSKKNITMPSRWLYYMVSAGISYVPQS